MQKLRPEDTCNVASTERTFIHPKTGKPTVMDTSRIGSRPRPAPDPEDYGADGEPFPRYPFWHIKGSFHFMKLHK